jgi:hypothetical protein
MNFAVLSRSNNEPILRRKMKSQRSHLAILTFLCGLSAIALGPVVPLQNVKGAPFQATLVKTSIRSGQQITTSGTVARNSNGSTYWEVAGIHPGLDSIVIILDVPNHRTITLYQKTNFYSIGPLDATIPISDAPSLQVVKQRIAQCEKKQTYHNLGEGYDSSDTNLGSRMQDGFVECGERVVYHQIPPTSRLAAKIWENWTIPALDLSVEYIGYDNNNQPVMTQKLTDIHVGEPDSTLFEIPPGYIPSPLPPSG